MYGRLERPFFISITRPWASGREQHKPDNLNYFNRPMRTRMQSGVGGERSGYLTAPIPILRETDLSFCRNISEIELW